MYFNSTCISQCISQFSTVENYSNCELLLLQDINYYICVNFPLLDNNSELEKSFNLYYCST